MRDLEKIVTCRKKIRVVEITSALLDQIEKTDNRCHAYLKVFHKEALERAAVIQKNIGRILYKETGIAWRSR